MSHAQRTGSINLGRHTVLTSRGQTRALHQLILGSATQRAIVVMTGLAEMGGAEAEPHGDRAAEAALELEVVLAVLGAVLHLQRRATTAKELGGIPKLIGRRCALVVTTKVRLLALEAHIVGELVHGEARRVVEPSGSLGRDLRVLVQSLILESHECLALHVFSQLVQRLCQIFQGRVYQVLLAQRACSETKGNSGPIPATGQHTAYTAVMEEVTALELNGRGCAQILSVAHTAQRVGVLFGLVLSGTLGLQAGQTFLLILDTTAGVTTLKHLLTVD